MKKNVTDQFTFDGQSLRALTDYLRAVGWQRIKYQNRRLAVYTKELQAGDPPAVVALPERVTLSDFSTRMTEAVQRLAEVEETTPGDIYQRIQSIGVDSIFLRLQLPSENALPSIEITSGFLHGVRDLIAYAACMEQEAKPYFTHAYAVGREQAERCQFDHTFHGSFGFTIRSPLPPPEEIELASPRSKMGRRVVERISRGLMSVQLAREKQKSEPISEQYESGLNGNMCKAVLEMLEDLPDTPIEYSVRWSLSLKPAQDVAQFTPIVLDREATYYLQDAVRALETPEPELVENTTVKGLIISLNAEKPSERQVTLLVDGYGKVNFFLDGEDYTQACDAHRDGTHVAVTGTLLRNSKGGEIWTLLSPRDFAVEK